MRFIQRFRSSQVLICTWSRFLVVGVKTIERPVILVVCIASKLTVSCIKVLDTKLWTPKDGFLVTPQVFRYYRRTARRPLLSLDISRGLQSTGRLAAESLFPANLFFFVRQRNRWQLQDVDEAITADSIARIVAFELRVFTVSCTIWPSTAGLIKSSSSICNIAFWLMTSYSFVGSNKLQVSGSSGRINSEKTFKAVLNCVPAESFNAFSVKYFWYGSHHFLGNTSHEAIISHSCILWKDFRDLETVSTR